MRIVLCAFSLSLLATGALAAADYDKLEKTKAYEIRLRIAGAAMAIAPLRDGIIARWKKETAEIKEQSTSDLIAAIFSSLCLRCQLACDVRERSPHQPVDQYLHR
jgi:hypothetical protein